MCVCVGGWQWVVGLGEGTWEFTIFFFTGLESQPTIHLVDNKYSVNIYYMPGVIVYETLANNMGEILSFYTSKLLYLSGSYSLILSLLNADIM